MRNAQINGSQSGLTACPHFLNHIYNTTFIPASNHVLHNSHLILSPDDIAGLLPILVLASVPAKDTIARYATKAHLLCLLGSGSKLVLVLGLIRAFQDALTVVASVINNFAQNVVSSDVEVSLPARTDC